MSEKQPDMVSLSPILRAALSSRQPGQDLDEAILRALKAEHPREALWLLSAANEMIELEAQRTGEDREQTVKRLAATESGLEVAVQSSERLSQMAQLTPLLRAALASRQPGEGLHEAPMVHLGPLLRAALASRQPGEDLDEALLRTLKAEHHEHAAMLLDLATGIIDGEVKRTGEDREQVVKRLAAEDPGPVFGVQAGGFGSLPISAKSSVLWVGGKQYGSLDELPPHLRHALEAALPPEMRRRFGVTGPAGQPEHGKPVRVVRGAGSTARTGCLMALLSALWKLIAR